MRESVGEEEIRDMRERKIERFELQGKRER